MILAFLLSLESCMAAPSAVDTVLAKNQFAIGRGSLPLLGAELGDDAVIALAARTDLPPIHELGLARNQIGPAAIEALLRAPWLAAPQSLDLQSNPALGEAGFRALGASSRLRTVTALWLAGSGGTPAGYTALFGPGNLAALQRFQGGLDQAGDTGALALAGLPALRFVVLKHAEIGPAGARALFAHPTLEALDVSDNAIGGGLTGLSALGPRLQSLTARNCGLGALDFVALSRADTGGLRILDVSDNPAGDDAVRAVAEAPWLAGLTSLTWMRTGASEAALARLRDAWGKHSGLAVGG